MFLTITVPEAVPSLFHNSYRGSIGGWEIDRVTNRSVQSRLTGTSIGADAVATSTADP